MEIPLFGKDEPYMAQGGNVSQLRQIQLFLIDQLCLKAPSPFGMRNIFRKWEEGAFKPQKPLTD